MILLKGISLLCNFCVDYDSWYNSSGMLQNWLVLIQLLLQPHLRDFIHMNILMYNFDQLVHKVLILAMQLIYESKNCECLNLICMRSVNLNFIIFNSAWCR